MSSVSSAMANIGMQGLSSTMPTLVRMPRYILILMITDHDSHCEMMLRYFGIPTNHTPEDVGLCSWISILVSIMRTRSTPALLPYKLSTTLPHPRARQQRSCYDATRASHDAAREAPTIRSPTATDPEGRLSSRLLA